MNCNCTDGCAQCGREPVIRQVFNCPGSQRVVRHEHIVRHNHDVVHEFDVIHEHQFTTRDVVREREVVNHDDCRTHAPNYCGDGCGCGGNGCGECGFRPMMRGTRFWNGGRRW
ncbi:MAG: hypothetical protein FWF79_05870 [Defluviitaleaceae bacterium]|nr:hypothetical protein [Defluviitaleaceae bacterium]